MDARDASNVVDGVRFPDRVLVVANATQNIAAAW